MIRLAWIGSLIAMATMSTFALASPGQGPFDAGRLREQPQARPAAGDASTLRKSSVSNVICGIRQDVQVVQLCVGGRWMSVAMVQRRFGVKIVSIGTIGVVLAKGRRVLLGEPLTRRANHEVLSSAARSEE